MTGHPMLRQWSRASGDQESPDQDHNKWKMVRTAAADELCEYCEVSLEFFSNVNRYLNKLVVIVLRANGFDTVTDTFTS